MPTQVAQVRALLRPYVGAIVVTAACNAVNAAAMNGRAYIMKPLSSALFSQMPAVPTTTGQARAPAAPMEFMILAGAILGLSLIVANARFFAEVLSKRTLVRALVELRLRVASHLMRVPIARYSRERVGDLLARLTTDIRASENAIRTVGFKVWEQSFMVIGALVTAAILSPLLTVILLAPFLPGAVVLLWAMGRRVRSQSERNLAAQADLTQSMQQILTGMKVIKVFHTESREKAAYAERSEAQFRRAQRVARARARSRGGAELLMNIGIATAIGFGGFAVIHGWAGLTLPTFTAFSLVLIQVYNPVRGVNQMWSSFQESLPAVERTTAVLEWSPETPDQPDATPCPPLAEGITLERVTFTYEGGDEPALDDVSLRFPAGKVTAIVGESGSGKSTALDLLLRLADPSAGTLRWNRHDLRTVQRDSLRERIALVSQDPFLFHASVAENLRYGRPDASQSDLEAAADAADALELIRGLPMGFDTIVGERGARLSGGERQRLTIARALLRDPDLLLLDEATAALDSASEARVLKALERLMQGRTTIWVAHRLVSIVQADQILVLERGRVVEQGTHAELLAGGRTYARLWEQQGLPPDQGAA